MNSSFQTKFDRFFFSSYILHILYIFKNEKKKTKRKQKTKMSEFVCVCVLNDTTEKKHKRH